MHNFFTEVTLTVIGALMGIEALALLRIERKGLVHYVAAAFCLIMGGFIAVFGFSLVVPTIQAATILGRFIEPLSIAVMPLFLHGIILLTARGANDRRRAWELFIYVPAAILLACCVRGPILFESYFLDERGIWVAINLAGGWPTYLYWVYGIGCFLVGLGFLFTWRLRAGSSAQRRLSRNLSLATGLALAVFCLNMVSNFVYLYRISPWLDFLGNLVFSLGFYVWIRAYRRAIVAVTGGVAEAASAGAAGGRGRGERFRRSLVALFGQPVLLLDREGRIEHGNHAAFALVGEGGEGRDPLGRTLRELLAEPALLDAALAASTPEARIEVEVAGSGRALTLSIRSMIGEAGLVAGYLCQCAESPPDPEAATRTSESLRLPYGEEVSAREYEVLFLLAEGLDVERIAERLFISPSTVKSHIHHLYQKTGARNRVDLVKLVGAT
jgi:DNA-binding CsgD family transcriptional regulator